MLAMLFGMSDKSTELMHHLSSSSCQKVLSCLREGLEHPDDISKAMGVVRQTVDWHLLKLSALDIVERIPVSSISGRPKITYRLSQDGENLIENIESLVDEHMKKLREKFNQTHKELDFRLARGDISERAYKDHVKRLKKEMNFLGF